MEHWLHHTATFRTAFEMLTNQMWRTCFMDEYTPTVRGAPVEWNGRVRSAFLFNWWNYIVFVPTDPDNVNVSSWSGEERGPLDRWLSNEIGREQRGRDDAAAARYEAEAGSNEDLPSRGLVSWSPAGSASEGDVTSTAAASDHESNV